MGIFGNIMNKIFHHGAAPKTTSAASPAESAPQAQPTPTPAVAPLETAPAAATAPAVTIDVGAVLAEMASMKDGGGGNYRSSIVDLLKLLDLDSSLTARKELGDELSVQAGADGSAEQNIALHKAVMAKLAENGGVVPDDLRN